MNKKKLSSPQFEITVDVCGNTTKESQSEKLLGLVVSHNLSWKPQMIILKG